jgi:serine/threonine protein kinase
MATSSSAHHLFRKENPRKYVERKEVIGRGSFGEVYRGVVLKHPKDDGTTQSEPKSPLRKYHYGDRKLGEDDDEEEVVAIKVISTYNEDIEEIAKELRFLMDLRSKYIVNYFDSYSYKGELWIVLELCDAGSLFDFRKATNCELEEKHLKAIMAYW